MWRKLCMYSVYKNLTCRVYNVDTTSATTLTEMSRHETVFGMTLVLGISALIQTIYEPAIVVEAGVLTTT